MLRQGQRRVLYLCLANEQFLIGVTFRRVDGNAKRCLEEHASTLSHKSIGCWTCKNVLQNARKKWLVWTYFERMLPTVRIGNKVTRANVPGLTRLLTNWRLELLIPFSVLQFYNPTTLRSFVSP